MPPSAYTLGWNILDTNLTVGGLLGYSSVNSIVNLNVPSSKGVSWGLTKLKKKNFANFVEFIFKRINFLSRNF